MVPQHSWTGNCLGRFTVQQKMRQNGFSPDWRFRFALSKLLRHGIEHKDYSAQDPGSYILFPVLLHQILGQTSERVRAWLTLAQDKLSCTQMSG
jgi:hypothetical protein